MAAITFHIADYVIMIGFLVVSMAIGIYYGFFKKQNTTDEYLLGNRQMHLIPVAMSLLVTFQSAISVTGVPAEVYLYNTMMLYIYGGIVLSNIIQAVWIVPLIYPLRITSVYEYVGMRFQSRLVQLFCTYIGMLQTMLYMSVVLFAPSLALEAVAGIPLWISIVVTGVVGTIYTSLGGMRSVIWTDVFQFIMLYGGIIAVLVVGTQRLGGVSEVMKVATSGKRIVFDENSLDPRVRHSLATTLVGGCFNWIPNVCNQASIQRICSMQSERDAKIACFLNVPLVIIYGALLILCGLLLYAFFQVSGCDPIGNGDISNANQIMPYFVMNVLNYIPGVTGVFIAALFSGALSSLSSGINSMAANTVEDILGGVLKNKSQLVCTLVAKFVVLVYGSMALGLAYLVKNLSGPVTQIALTAIGATGGPVSGIFFLGAMFPQANWIGALVGGILSTSVSVWIAIGSVLYGNKSQLSPPVTTAFCDVRNATLLDDFQTATGTEYMTTSSSSLLNTTSILPTTAVTPTEHLVIYDISYLYIGMIGFFISLLVEMLVSLITGMDKSNRTAAKFVFPCCRRIWRLRQHYVPTPYYQRHGQVVFKRDGEQHELSSAVAPIRTVDTAWYRKVPDDQL